MTPSLLKEILNKLRPELRKDLDWYVRAGATDDEEFLAKLLVSVGDVLIQELGE